MAVLLAGCVGPAITDHGYRAKTTGALGTRAMTETGGFAFLIAWTEFIALGLLLFWTITRRR